MTRPIYYQHNYYIVDCVDTRSSLSCRVYSSIPSSMGIINIRGESQVERRRSENRGAVGDETVGF